MPRQSHWPQDCTRLGLGALHFQEPGSFQDAHHLRVLLAPPAELRDPLYRASHDRVRSMPFHQERTVQLLASLPPPSSPRGRRAGCAELVHLLGICDERAA